MKALIQDLSSYSIEDITTTFTRWRKKSTKIPTCKDILDLLQEILSEKATDIIPYVNFQGSWPEYQEYLKSQDVPVSEGRKEDV